MDHDISQSLKLFPQTEGRHWHLNLAGLWAPTVSGKSIGHGIDHAGGSPNGAQFANALHAQDIVGAGHGLVGQCMEHLGHDVGAWGCVVHQTARHQLTAFSVIDQAF